MQKNVMPKIVVTSKRKFPEWVKKTKESGELWAYISIEGTDDLVEARLISDNIHYLPEGPDVLNLRFDDIEEYEEKLWGGKLYKIYPMTSKNPKDFFAFFKANKR